MNIKKWTFFYEELKPRNYKDYFSLHFDSASAEDNWIRKWPRKKENKSQNSHDHIYLT